MTPERQHPEQVQTRLPAAQAAALDIVPGDPGVPPVRHQSAWLLSAGILSLLGVVTAVHLYHAIGTRPTFSLAHQASGDPAVGQQLYRAYGCGSCHTDHPLSTSRGEVGPRLNDFAHS
ncbi:MAG: hypothetical protein Q4C67_05835, partial [Deinococcus sp.]|nr:hypothetical protein [Deinococcus sp.]